MKNLRINVTVDNNINNILEERAKKTGESVAECARYFMKRGMAMEYVDESADIIAKVVRQQIESVMNPKVERICALTSKVGHMSARGTFLNVQCLQELVDAEKRKDVVPMYDKASKMAAAFMKSNLDDEGSGVNE